MRKKLKKFFLLTLVIFLYGCGKTDNIDTVSTEESATVTTEEVRFAERYRNISLSEAGVIYDGNDGLTHLVTIDECEDIILCYDSNCDHSTVSRYNPYCMAVRYGGLCMTAFYENAIYYFRMDDIGVHSIYKADLSGTGRKKIAQFPFLYVIGYVCIFKNDKVYYTAEIPHKDEITNDISYTYRFVEVDLIDGSYRFLTEESSNVMNICEMVGDTFYMKMSDFDNNGAIYMATLDLNTLETNVIISNDTWVNEYTYVGVYDEDSYFYWDRQTYEMGLRNVDGTIEEVVLKGAEGEGYGWQEVSGMGLFYERELDYGDEKAGFYFMDLDTGISSGCTKKLLKVNEWSLWRV